jgi:AhpD family alkylhydroperoxidase
MAGPFTQAADQVFAGIGLLREAAPEAGKAFGSLAVAATTTRALDAKTKELMALSISIAVHCEGCVAYHTRAAHKHGASRQEVAETVALAVYMGGGPAAVYGAEALRAYDEFAASTAA